MATYLSYFGLKKAPFAAHVVGANVFVSPPSAAIMAALKKAMATEDAAVCLSGPVGSGKTTIAKRSIDGLGQSRGIVTIGRMPFGPDEVLEILLAGLGAKQLPRSTVHRFATFRRMLQQFAEQNTRVFILVEDASRVGADVLSELEALTAADAGVSNGANLILLGDSNFKELLQNPKLARLKQRVRTRQNIESPGENEMQAYLKHCFRLAGGEFDAIFGMGCANALHRFTDGLPRMVNNLVEFVLTVAAEQHIKPITPQLIERVAAEEFGLTGEHNATDIAAAIEKAAVADKVAAPVSAPAPIPEPIPEAIPEPSPEPLAAPISELEAAVPADDETVEDAFDEIPDLIQDTLPDLAILPPSATLQPKISTPAAPPSRQAAESKPASAPQVKAPAKRVAAQAPGKPGAEHEPTEDELPVLSSSMRLQIPSIGKKPSLQDVPAEARDEDGKVPPEVPEWERDPTLAELRPDLEALERAMAMAAQSSAEDDDPPNSLIAEALARQSAPAVPAKKEVAPEIIPEITLDKQIEAKIQEAMDALKQTQTDATADLRDSGEASNDDSSVAAPARKPQAAAKPQVAAKPRAAAEPQPAAQKPAKDPKRADRELEKIASDLAKAKTIEDVDDHMAETLFGEELSMLAAQVAAHASLQFGNASEAEVAPGGNAALQLVDEAPQQASAVTGSTPSQRLKVLRELNGDTPKRGAAPAAAVDENIVMSNGGLDAPPGDDLIVDSIEDQIETSMTQTLQALTIRLEAKSGNNRHDEDEDDDDDGSSKGFFSRFRRK